MQIIKIPHQFKNNNILISHLYFEIKWTLIDQGYADEVDWQDELCLNSVTENDFLREAAWVIISSGMSERAVKIIFPKITRAFFNWESTALILDNKDFCLENALIHFNRKPKIDAIIYLASYVAENGYETVKEKIYNEGVNFLIRFPYLGSATAAHLAKNIGIPVAKQDRHLERISRLLGYPNANDMCSSIANTIDENISVVDLVFWRFATLRRNYLETIAYKLNQFGMA